ncbi:MAG: hypothetical protein OXI84_04760 [bacterium]|nr:hypothetical protein [bacterium]
MMYWHGIDESAAQGIVEDVADGTSPLVTRDMLRADMYRALWIQGAGIVAAIGGITEVIG